jgi:hypothetical protein
VIAFDKKDARQAGEVRAHLAATGIGIVGHVVASDLVLVTRNAREFERISGCGSRIGSAERSHHGSGTQHLTLTLIWPWFCHGSHAICAGYAPNRIDTGTCAHKEQSGMARAVSRSGPHLGGKNGDRAATQASRHGEKTR